MCETTEEEPDSKIYFGHFYLFNIVMIIRLALTRAVEGLRELRPEEGAGEYRPPPIRYQLLLKLEIPPSI